MEGGLSRSAVRAFGRTYKQHWLIERHGYRTPIEARDQLRVRAAAITYLLPSPKTRPPFLTWSAGLEQPWRRCRALPGTGSRPMSRGK
jgi:hypothetical protein